MVFTPRGRGGGGDRGGFRGRGGGTPRGGRGGSRGPASSGLQLIRNRTNIFQAVLAIVAVLEIGAVEAVAGGDVERLEEVRETDEEEHEVVEEGPVQREDRGQSS